MTRENINADEWDSFNASFLHNDQSQFSLFSRTRFIKIPTLINGAPL